MLHFLTQNNCFHGKSTRNFNNGNYCILHRRVNLHSCFQKPCATKWLFLRNIYVRTSRNSSCSEVPFPYIPDFISRFGFFVSESDNAELNVR